MRKPKSPNVSPNPLRVILNNLHYEQRCINRLDNTTLSLDMGHLNVLPKLLAYKHFPIQNLKTIHENGWLDQRYVNEHIDEQ